MAFDVTTQRSTSFKQIFLDAFSKGINVTAGGVSVTANPAPPSPSPASPAPTAPMPTTPKVDGVSNIVKFGLAALAAVIGLAYVSAAHRR